MSKAMRAGTEREQSSRRGRAPDEHFFDRGSLHPPCARASSGELENAL